MITSVYKLPLVKLGEFLNDLSQYLEEIKQNANIQNHLLLGDINTDIRSDTDLVSEYLDVLA